MVNTYLPQEVFTLALRVIDGLFFKFTVVKMKGFNKPIIIIIIIKGPDQAFILTFTIV